MFKIIKTSTYDNLIATIDFHIKKSIIDNKTFFNYCEKTNEEIRLLKEQLHHLTAKKLPIKKSKNE